MREFELAGGGVPGRDHILAAKNSHDAYCIDVQEHAIVAVVCDGCGSGSHSEVGAKIGARLIVQAAHACAGHFSGVDLWEAVRHETLTRIKDLAQAMGGSLSKTVNDYFLFTAVAAVITPLSAEFVAIGDGICVVNGERIAIGPFPDNAPPYLSYGLVKTTLHDKDPELLKFRPLRSLPVEELQSFLIGTDGIDALIAAAEKTFPGTQVPIGTVDQLWSQDKYFRNPDMVRRLLARANGEKTAIDWDGRQIHKAHGLLPDDATVIAGRRRKETQS